MDYNQNNGGIPNNNDNPGNTRYPGYQNEWHSYSAGQQQNSAPNQPGWQSNIYQPYQQPGYRYPSTPPTPPTEPPRTVEYSEPEKKAKKDRSGMRHIAAIAAVAIISGTVGGVVGQSIAAGRYQDAPVSEVSETQAYRDDDERDEAPVASGVSIAPTSITEVVSKASDSVVEISVEVVAGDPFFGRYVAEGGGSGVIISEDGYIATNDHVIESAQSIKVRTKNGDEYDAWLIGTDSKTDLAVIKVDANGLKPVSYADSDKIMVGETAVAIGNPLGTLGGTVTAGIISARDREITIGGETMTLLQTSAAVNPGNSGGGLFNANGDLVGVINAKSSGVDVEGLGFAIPSNLVEKVTKELINNGYVSGRPQLGITIREITDVRTAWMYGVEEPGVYIVSAGENSPLQVNDRIVKVADVEIKSSIDVKDAIANMRVGDEIDVIVKRSGKEVALKVTLQEQTPISAEIPQVQESDM